MSTFMNRAKDKARGLELPDTSTLRERMPDTAVLRSRVMAAVEEALDRAEDAWNDAPSAKEAAGRVRSSRAASRAVEATATGADRARHSRVGEATTAAVAAGLPLITSIVRERAKTKTKAVRRAARVAPMALRSNPLLLSASVVGGVVLGVAAVRRIRARGHDDSQSYELSGSARAALDDDVSRMEGEGGDLGAYDGSPTPLRRFVRTADGGTGTGTGDR